MSRRQSSSDVEVGFLNGAHEWLAGVERDYKVFTRCEIVPKVGKGQFSVRMIACVAEKGGSMRVIAQITQTFPNVSNQTLAGLFLAQSMSLERIVSNWALDQVGLLSGALNEG
jgi:hypothetical protein